jgi:hypothetical protein
VAAFFQALRDGGFKAVATHFNPRGVRTDAPASVMQNILRKMTEQNEPAWSDKGLRVKTASSKKHTNGDY